MDPLSIAASTATLIDIAVKATSSLRSYISSLKTVDENLSQLHNEVQRLTNKLTTIQSQLEECKNQSETFNLVDDKLWNYSTLVIGDCNSALQTLTILVEDIQNLSRSTRPWRRAKLVHSFHGHEKEIEHLKDKIKTSNSGLHTILSVITVSLTLQSNKSSNFVLQQLKNLENSFNQAFQTASTASNIASGVSDIKPDTIASGHLRGLASEAKTFHSSVISTASTTQDTRASNCASDSGATTYEVLSPTKRERIKDWQNQPYDMMTGALQEHRITSIKTNCAKGFFQAQNSPDECKEYYELVYIHGLQRLARETFVNCDFANTEGSLEQALKKGTSFRSDAILTAFTTFKLQLVLCYFLQDKWKLAEPLIEDIAETRPDAIIFNLMHALSLAYLNIFAFNLAKDWCFKTLVAKKNFHGESDLSYQTTLSLLVKIFEMEDDGVRADVFRLYMAAENNYQHPDSPVDYICHYPGLLQEVFGEDFPVQWQPYSDVAEMDINTGRRATVDSKLTNSSLTNQRNNDTKTTEESPDAFDIDTSSMPLSKRFGLMIDRWALPKNITPRVIDRSQSARDSTRLSLPKVIDPRKSHSLRLRKPTEDLMGHQSSLCGHGEFHLGIDSSSIQVTPYELPGDSPQIKVSAPLSPPSCDYVASLSAIPWDSQLSPSHNLSDSASLGTFIPRPQVPVEGTVSQQQKCDNAPKLRGSVLCPPNIQSNVSRVPSPSIPPHQACNSSEPLEHKWYSAEDVGTLGQNENDGRSELPTGDEATELQRIDSSVFPHLADHNDYESHSSRYSSVTMKPRSVSRLLPSIKRERLDYDNQNMRHPKLDTIRPGHRLDTALLDCNKLQREVSQPTQAASLGSTKEYRTSRGPSHATYEACILKPDHETTQNEISSFDMRHPVSQGSMQTSLSRSKSSWRGPQTSDIATLISLKPSLTMPFTKGARPDSSQNSMQNGLKSLRTGSSRTETTNESMAPFLEPAPSGNIDTSSHGLTTMHIRPLLKTVPCQPGSLSRMTNTRISLNEDPHDKAQSPSSVQSENDFTVGKRW